MPGKIIFKEMFKMTKIEVDSSKSQDIKRKFVEREVIANVNSMVSYILQNKGTDAPFSYDDIENLYIPVCPECGNKEKMTEKENKKGDTIYKCNYCKKTFTEEPDTEPQEVYEWWMVSGWLCGLLQEKGEVIIESESIWGRCTTGQAILLDGVISDICKDLEILEGQKNEWKV
jgi:hypothetical protein